jgi:hypothetical protein
VRGGGDERWGGERGEVRGERVEGGRVGTVYHSTLFSPVMYMLIKPMFSLQKSLVLLGMVTDPLIDQSVDMRVQSYNCIQ